MKKYEERAELAWRKLASPFATAAVFVFVTSTSVASALAGIEAATGGGESSLGSVRCSDFFKQNQLSSQTLEPVLKSESPKPRPGELVEAGLQRVPNLKLWTEFALRNLPREQTQPLRRALNAAFVRSSVKIVPLTHDVEERMNARANNRGMRSTPQPKAYARLATRVRARPLQDEPRNANDRLAQLFKNLTPDSSDADEDFAAEQETTVIVVPDAANVEPEDLKGVFQLGSLAHELAHNRLAGMLDRVAPTLERTLPVDLFQNRNFHWEMHRQLWSFIHETYALTTEWGLEMNLAASIKGASLEYVVSAEDVYGRPIRSDITLENYREKARETALKMYVDDERVWNFIAGRPTLADILRTSPGQPFFQSGPDYINNLLNP